MSETNPEAERSGPGASPGKVSARDRTAEQSAPESNSSQETEQNSENTGPRRRRRGSRGGRNRSSAARAAARQASQGSDSPENEAGAAESEATQDGNAEKPRIGDSRPSQAKTSGRLASKSEGKPVGKATDRSKPKSKLPDSKNDEQDESSQGEQGDGPAKRKRRRGGRRRGGAKKPVEQTFSNDDDQEPAIELDEATLEKRRGKERKGRPVGRYMMCVQVRDKATQIAVMEGRSLIEHYVSRPHDDVSQIDGNVYLSRVQNVLPGMEAAFIDIGTPKNAVLYRGDARYDADELEGAKQPEGARIEEMLKGGQSIVTQVTKNPIGTKGARLTQEVSLPGRFVVLMPNSSTYGISKRLPDNERKRLRKTLDEVKPAQHGIIVRTAAEGVVAEELRRDVQRLVRQWEEIEAKAEKSHAPELLYREPDIAVRIIREEFNKEYRGVIIDDRALYEEVSEYVGSISPELADRIKYYDGEEEPLPLFERYHVHEQLHKALDRKVWLPSGGSLIIERTEALTVIDVNTGKNVGKSNLEETVFKNNLEAAEEIAHQLRLRDIGGIIVIDFIDMEIKKNRDEVLNCLRDALARDKTRTQAYPIGELGLVEMTRKRISEGLVESFSEGCPTCVGRGFVIDEELLES
jgi:ribonuclease E